MSPEWLGWSWSSSQSFGEVQFDHANPFSSGDWKYIDEVADYRSASDAIRRSENRLGVIGHTHRPRVYEVDQGAEWWGGGPLESPLHVEGDSVCVVNAGSVGQPRDVGAQSTMLSVRRHGGSIEIEHHYVFYDHQLHRRFDPIFRTFRPKMCGAQTPFVLPRTGRCLMGQTASRSAGCPLYAFRLGLGL